jgi:preprotein translocase subunit SecD
LGLIAAVLLLAVLAVFPMEGRVKLGLDLKGGVHIVLQAKPASESEAANESTGDPIERLIAVLRNRIDQYGIVEPQIQREGADRVAVDLPGVEDPEAALDLIGRTAMLEFRQVTGAGPSMPPDVERKNYATDEAYETALERWRSLVATIEEDVKGLEERAKSDDSIVLGRDDENNTYLLGQLYVTGGDLVGARITQDELARPAVSLEFNSAGATAFENATAENIEKRLAIVLDGNVISAPVVRARISGGNAIITGNFKPDDAIRLAVMLNAGALPMKVEILENRSVGPTLGEDSIRSGLTSGLIGGALVMVFMLVYYGMLGLAADVAMIMSMLVLMAAMILMKTTLTLPGIGGIVLTIGMAVDGNILIYERMKEEALSGKTIMAALDSGFRKALVVILDSNVTTLIAAGVLFYFGSGPVRGFSVTLSLGVLASMFGNIVVTRALLQIILRARQNAAL